MNPIFTSTGSFLNKACFSLLSCLILSGVSVAEDSGSQEDSEADFNPENYILEDYIGEQQQTAEQETQTKAESAFEEASQSEQAPPSKPQASKPKDSKTESSSVALGTELPPETNNTEAKVENRNTPPALEIASNETTEPENKPVQTATAPIEEPEETRLTDEEIELALSEADTPMSDQVEALKEEVLKLNRDLFILEEDLLFPASTQFSLYVSTDADRYFEIDSIKVKINDELVTAHLYTENQKSALRRGGIQKLHTGNLKTGEHELVAIFIGYGPGKAEYKRAVTHKFMKDTDPIQLEIRISDEQRTQQPRFEVHPWN